MDGLKVGVFERQYARRGVCFPNGMARQYRLTFRNVLRVCQGEENTEWLVKRNGEKTGRDVRRRLMYDGYDDVRIEYDGGVVDYVAFSNRNIMPMSGDVNVNSVVAKNAHK